MTGTLHIGALARRSGRSVYTLRWYEREGLMPGVIRDNGGRRVYREDHLVWLEFLDRLRLTGMSVAEMRRYAELVLEGRATLGDRRALLELHRQRIVADIEDRRRALALVEAKIEYYRRWEAEGRRPERLPSLADIELDA